MPLHVFESRYRAMMGHVIEQPATRRWIALALLAEGFEPVYQTLAAPIRSTVCVGRLTEFQRLADGRFNILLAGMWRGRVTEEDRSGRFRLACIEELPTDTSAFEAVAQELLASIELSAQQMVSAGFVEAHLMQWIVTDSASPSMLIDRLAFYTLDQADSAARQAVLEAQDLRRRAELLVKSMQNRLAAHRKQPIGPSKRPDWPPGTSVN